MAQALVVVCDACGSPAVETVTIKVADRSYQKDVCQTHTDQMIHGARAPRRGRPRTKAAPAAARKQTKRKAPARAQRTGRKAAQR
jgi:hypothetical protein